MLILFVYQTNISTNHLFIIVIITIIYINDIGIIVLWNE